MVAGGCIERTLWNHCFSSMRRGIVVGFWVVPVLLGRLRGDVPWAGVAAVRGQGGVGYHELPVISEIFILGLAAGYLLQVRSVFFGGGRLVAVLREWCCCSV